MVKNNTRKAVKFFRNRAAINRIVRNQLGRRQLTIHGARAVNAQLPRFLNKPTQDYDVFTKTPQRSAVRLEKKLDRKFRGDFFRVIKGASKVVKVRKVVSNINQENIVDFAKPNRFVPTTNIQGLKFATLGDQKRAFIKNLTSPTAKFRREKDLEALRRIRLFEELRGRQVR